MNFFVVMDTSRSKGYIACHKKNNELYYLDQSSNTYLKLKSIIDDQISIGWYYKPTLKFNNIDKNDANIVHVIVDFQIRNGCYLDKFELCQGYYSDDDNTYHFKNGRLHHDKTFAVKLSDGTRKWYYHGRLHNEHCPAIQYPSGSLDWYYHGKLHCTSGPAIINSDGTKIWMVHGKRHRINGPALEYANGDKFWMIDDKLHRDNGPAVELANGKYQWYKDGIPLINEWMENYTKCIFNE